MFVDFNKIMKPKEEPKSQIPDALVEYLNQKLPEGVKYHKTKDGDYQLVPDGKGNFSMGDLVFRPNEHQKQILGETCSFDDVLEYINNSQKPMRIGTKDGKTVLVNGKRMSLNDIFLSPNIEYNDDNFIQYIYPQKFPEPHAITLSCDDVSEQIYIQRIANDSVHEKIFESLSNEFIFFKLKINENKSLMSITIRINTDNVDRIDTLIIAMKLCNAFTSGKLKIDNQLIKLEKMDPRKNQFNLETIEYWEKLLRIESVLNLEFKPNSNKVDFQTANEVEKLYQCLIKKEPYRENKSFSKLTGIGNTEEEIKSSIGKPIYLTYDGKEHFNLYGQEFDLFYRSLVFNCVFRIIETGENEKVTIYLDNLDEEKQRYTTTLLFQNESDLDSYNLEENIEKFHDARSFFEINRELLVKETRKQLH